jgi:endogenous inhibitor of DNA gyrase (YacG/DUF329 family)
MKNNLVKSSLTIKCPKCGSLTNYDNSNKSRPFCSDRCKNEDIVDWANESYGIPDPASEIMQDQSLMIADSLDDDI